MLFNSFAYAIFLPCIFGAYWILPYKCRWLILLIASYYFYMRWNVRYAVLIAATTIVSYFCALLLEKMQRNVWKNLILFLALLVSGGILYVFKYFNFSMDLLSYFISVNPVHLNLILPVGISFYTFQTVGYVIDVYRGEVRAEKNIGIYAAFVSFFPQLVAGPIERTVNLMPQIKNKKQFDYSKACYGSRLILWGLYKKMVIADNLALFVDKIYGGVTSFTCFSLLLAMFFFSIQIYCDFSGYSDIARGSAKLFNIELMENFRSPYFSAGIREFWGRWHISLSSWFRDYVYIPMGGNRVSKSRNIMNILCTFLVSGLWHGASFNFIIWGGLHGVRQVYENAFEVKEDRNHDIYWCIRVVCTYLFVTFAWNFFRASDMHDAVYVLRNMFSGIGNLKTYLINGLDSLEINWHEGRKIIVLYYMPLFLYDFFSIKEDVCMWIGKKNIVIRYMFIFVIIVMILLYGYVGKSNFVYFQF